MLANKIILTPAKLNIFLRGLGRRKDGYHIIRTGITFINLFDHLEISNSKKLNIIYKGPFKPSSSTYSDCIILKTLRFLNLDKTLKLEIKITKNIPVKGGLGSASTNASALIRELVFMKIIKDQKPDYYATLGADIPSFLFKKNCLARGIGEKLYTESFPKYFFLIVKPEFDNSTKEMYSKLGFKKASHLENIAFDSNQINEEDVGNDFEKVVYKNNKEFIDIMDFLQSLNNVIFSRMTGSGSCCYAAFEKKNDALQARNIFKKKFSKLWTFIAENNY